MSFIEFLNEELNDAKFGSKKTKTLKIEVTDEILKDFSNTRKEIYKSNKTYKSQGLSWTIFIEKQTGDVWGVSGDYWFGHAPSYMNNKYGGNIKAAEEVYSEFMKEYNIK
jgi:hypothetical protein